MMSTKQRISKNKLRVARLLEKPLRVIYSSDFDKTSKKVEIMAEMPDISTFNELRKKVFSLRNSDNVTPEMRPCYEEPLLTKEQEFHLFRKMNYMKYRAKKLIDRLNEKKSVTNTHLTRIENLLEEADKIRNQIANSNFRLATMTLRQQNFYREHNISENLLSDGYFDVLKAIEYFDFNRGFKFSTYCTWVLKKNLSRDMQVQARYQEKFTTGYDEPFYCIPDEDEGRKKELVYESNKKLVNKLLDVLSESGCNGDVKRQVYALQEWYGLNGKNHRTLEDISRDMGITKERVRQLKERGLKIIKEKVKELGIQFEEITDDILA